jgi:sugar phosphate isomerase/epimerase
MVAPAGLHVTTPDNALRQKSWEHIRHLIDLCADLAADQEERGIMVFGSPKQRSSTGGLAPAEATRNYVDGLRSVTGHAESNGVTILVESLSHDQSDIVNTVAEAVAIVEEIGNRTPFDRSRSLLRLHPPCTH